MEEISIYSDESGIHGSERYQAIGAFSGGAEDLTELEKAIAEMQVKHGVSNVSYKNISDSYDVQNAMREIIKVCLGQCVSAQVRLDIIIWDMQDKRHKIIGRDDNENLKRMYYRLLAQIMYRWRVPRLISFYPDEKISINWSDDIQKFITTARKIVDTQFHGITLGGNRRENKIKFTETSEEVDDNDEPLVQAADLIAGLVRKSYEEGESFERWASSADGNQQSLGFEAQVEVSNAQRSRFELMKKLRTTAKSHSLGLRFRENQRLETNKYHQSKPLNVWKFEHQDGHDQAPVR
jgi:hypothetical protein